MSDLFNGWPEDGEPDPSSAEQSAKTMEHHMRIDYYKLIRIIVYVIVILVAARYGFSTGGWI